MSWLMGSQEAIQLVDLIFSIISGTAIVFLMIGTIVHNKRQKRIDVLEIFNTGYDNLIQTRMNLLAN